MNPGRICSRRLLLCLLILALVSWYSPWARSFATDDSVPEGFESLAGPRPMFVDIIFNDQLVGTAGVLVEGDRLSFDEPDLILALLESVEPDETLLDELASSLPTNVDRLCYRPGDPIGCGTLEPDPIALLFDEDTLKVTLFVDPALQKIRTDNSSRYLNPPLRRGSAILAFDTAATSIGGEDWQYDLRGEGWFGYGRGYLRSIMGVDSQKGNVQLGSLALVHRLQDHELLAGSYSFPVGPALSGFDVLGLRMSTSLQTRIDPERARGSELSVLLDRRAIVQLLVDGRLYSTQSLDAGHVAVDTADLPDGSMEVEVRIVDPISGERTEFHRFTRSTLLPPRDEMGMAVAIGAPLKREGSEALPELHRIGVGSVRVARRTGENSALTLGFAHLGKLDLVQPEFVMLGRHLTLQTSASLGIRGELGFGLRGVWRHGLLSASLSGEWFDYGSTRSAASNSMYSRKPWIPNETGHLSASLDSVFGRTSIGLYGSVRREFDGPRSYNSTGFGLGIRHRLFDRASLRSSLSARLRLERGVFNASVDLRISFGNSSRLNSLLLGVATNNSSRNSSGGENSESFQSIAGVESRWRGQPDAEWQIDGGIWANGGSSSSTVGFDAGIGHQTFSADIQSQWREQDSIKPGHANNLDTALHLSTQLVLDDSGMAFAGNDAVRAGFIVDIEGEPAGAAYSILVNSAQVGTGRVGTPAFVSLPPFAHYEVQLQPHSLLASTFEQESFEVTLYPGNILRKNIVARQRFLLIATVVDTRDNLLSNAVLQRDGGPLLIGTDGLLQIETSKEQIFQALKADGTSCQLSVPSELGDDEVVVLDVPLVCQ